MHQDLHLDDEEAFVTPKDECFIYHVPLCEEGLKLRVAYVRLSKSTRNVELYERMLYVPFGSCILLPPTLIHGGHYGKSGNLRLHGVISVNQWNGDDLLPLNSCIERMFPPELNKN